MTEDFSKLKLEILKSGIPLEVSVSKKLIDLGYENIREYNYVRETENKVFQLDVIGSKTIFEGEYEIDPLAKKVEFKRKVNVSLRMSCECKYKTRNQKWFFTKYGSEGYKGPNITHYDNIVRYPLRAISFAEIDVKAKNKKLDETYPIQDVFQIVKEINGNSNEQPIKEAQFQLYFASAKRIVNSLIINLSRELNREKFGGYEDIKIDIYLPIIVTTADLYVLKKSTIEEIENANNLEDICEKKDSILLSKRAPIEVEKYMEDIFEKEFEDMIKEMVGGRNVSVEDSNIIGEYRQILYNLLNRIYVINYSSLSEELKKIEGYYQSVFSNSM